MSDQVQRRRDPKADNEAFTGAEGEFIFETDSKRIAAHDGSRQGGYPIPHFEDIQKQAFNFASAGGTATAITVSTDVNPDSLVAGLKITLKMTAAATGAATLAWGTLTATNIKLLAAGVKSDPGADTWAVGDYVDFIFDGTDFIALSAGGGGGGLIDYQVFTASGTWTKPAGTNKIKVTVIGGGGGGTSAARFPTNGSAGGTSSFGSHCSASGGSGTSGGIGSNGDINLRGGGGFGSSGQFATSNAQSYGSAGNGGSSSLGGGGAGRNANATGVSGSFPGGGGGGAAVIASAFSGQTNYYGAGGGGGGTAIKFISTGIGATETVTVGGGGGGGSSGAAGVVIVESFK